MGRTFVAVVAAVLGPRHAYAFVLIRRINALIASPTRTEITATGETLGVSVGDLVARNVGLDRHRLVGREASGCRLNPHVVEAGLHAAGRHRLLPDAFDIDRQRVTFELGSPGPGVSKRPSEISFQPSVAIGIALSSRGSTCFKRMRS